MEDPQSEKSVPPSQTQRRTSHILNVPHSKALEDRIKDELISLGLFEAQEVRSLCVLSVVMIIAFDFVCCLR